MSFKTYGKPGNFKPVVVPDESEKILSSGQKQIQGMRDVQRQDMENQTSIRNTINRSNQLEQESRQANFNAAEREIQLKRDASMQNFKVLQSNAANKAEEAAKNMQAVANISKTAFEVVQGFVAEREKGRQDAYAMAVYESGVTTTEAIALTKLDTNFSADALSKNQTVKALLDRGVSLETIQFLSESGRQSGGRYIDSKALMQNTVAGAPFAFEEMKQGTFNVLGTEMTYEQAISKGDLKAVKNIQQQMNRKFITESGLSQMSPEMLGTQAFPDLKNYWKRENSTVLKSVRDGMKAKALEETMAVFDTQYGSDGVSGAWGLVESSPDRRQGRNDFFKWAQESAESGNTNLTFNEIAGHKVTIGGKTRTMQEWFGKTDEFQDMKKAFGDKRKLDRYERKEAFEENKLQFQEATEDVKNYLMSQDNLTQQQVDDAKLELRNQFGMDASSLDDIVVSDDRLIAGQTAEVEAMARDGSLTLSALSQYDYRVFRKFQDVARRYSDAGKSTNNFKVQTDAIKDMVKLPSFVKFGKDGTADPTVRLKTAQLTRQFNKEVAARLAADPAADPNQVGNQVLREIRDEFNEEYNNDKVKGDLYVRRQKEGYFDVWDGTTTAADEKEKVAKGLDSIDRAVLKDANEALRTPGLVVDEASAEVLTSSYGQPGWKPGAEVTYMADRLGITPLQVINSQLEALNEQGADYELLKPTPSQEAIQKNVRPEIRKILEQYNTPERSVRGLGSAGKWMKEVVPHGYGDYVEQASQANGVRTWDVAALIEIESSWNVNAVSETGAAGLMQISENSHPEYTYSNDPQEQIAYGTKYYGQMVQQFGDPVIAAGAYNVGPNAMLDHLENGTPLPQETIDHMKKFKIAQYKYGKKDVLQDPQVMRPSSPVAVYITGNIGPTSTGPHLDVKQVGGGRFEENALDDYVEVEDPEFGRISLGELRQRTGGVGDNWQEHANRGSHGIDYGTYSGTPVYLKNGAKKVGSRPSPHGDVVTIELPTGQQYTFLHGTKS